MKNWILKKKTPIIIVLVAVICGYYLYLTNMWQHYELDKTYCVKDEYSMIVLEFNGDTLSTYLINPDINTAAIRTDYRIGFRRYQKDFLGNFWGENGIEPFMLRGSDVAGDLYAQCVGCVIWPNGEEMRYLDEDQINDLEDSENTNYSFVSRFAIYKNHLCVFNYFDISFEEVSDLPAVETEIIRLMNSLCPPEF